MALEDEIKQTRFSGVHEKMVLNVLFTGNWVAHQNLRRLKPFGLTPEQYNVLRILRGSHPRKLRLADITCRMLDRSSNATRLVEKLRLKGLVSREICDSNRRQVDIRITGQGLDLLAEIDLTLPEWQKGVAHLSEQEAQQLNELLDKLRARPKSEPK